MRRPSRTILLRAGLLSAVFAGLLAGFIAFPVTNAAARGASGPTRTVRYHGVVLRVPSAWPVFDLSRSPATCVRFDRHAVYLGTPSSRQVCPSAPAGRTEAILVSPGDTPAGAAGVGAGSVARLVRRAAGVTIIATWREHPAVVARALGLRSLAAAKRAANRRPSAASTPRSTGTSHRGASSSSSAGSASPGAASTSSTATPGEVYTGKGFDTCSTPSAATMNSWAGSYHAIGVYIGGENMACSQTNLTSAWVQDESALGWHLIPIYVGLQAPESSCGGCASMTTAQAASEGTSDAENAVAQAESVGLGTGNPIYDDMESYDEGGSDSKAVLAYLEAWTEELHTLGYLSGVYSSDDSGIYDLANAPSGYVEPDDIWFAYLDGEANTEDGELGSTQWVDHTRLHQYEDGVDQTHGGAALQIDEDYLDSATAAAGSTSGVTSPDEPPVAAGPPTIRGAAVLGQTLTDEHAHWVNAPASYTYEWETCPSAGGGGGTGPSQPCTAIADATGRTLTVTSVDVGSTIRVLETAGNSFGSGSPDASAPTSTVTTRPSSGYWLASSDGNVLGSPGLRWYGSPLGLHVRNVVGIAATRSDRGYWVATRSGEVYAYGNARHVVARRVRAPVRAVVTSPRGGVWLLTSHGNVLNLGGAPFYGSPAHSHLSDDEAVAMAPTTDGRGYWVLDADGAVHSYGDATTISAPTPAHPVVAALAAPAGGLWVLTDKGNLDNLGGAPFFGSPAHAKVSSVTGMARTADGNGYWIVDAAGQVFAYGDAGTYAVSSHAGSIVAASGG